VTRLLAALLLTGCASSLSPHDREVIKLSRACYEEHRGAVDIGWADGGAVQQACRRWALKVVGPDPMEGVARAE